MFSERTLVGLGEMVRQHIEKTAREVVDPLVSVRAGFSIAGRESFVPM